MNKLMFNLNLNFTNLVVFPFQILHGEDVGTAADGERGAGAHAG